MAARATFALKAGLCVRRTRLAIVAPDMRHSRRSQAVFPLIDLSEFARPPLGMEWILKLAAAGGKGPSVDIMEISKPDDLSDIASLGLNLAEAKRLLARVQCEISTAQASRHAVRRPVCPCREEVCRVKDYRDHSVATLFGQVTVRLPRFRCAACGRTETGLSW